MSGLTNASGWAGANYWPLIKSRQTLLLTLTGVAGFLYQQEEVQNWLLFAGLLGSLLLTISGSSVLNMLFDRDIDRMMWRTRQRPLVVGLVKAHSAATFGVILIGLGLLVAAVLSWMYFFVILAGTLVNVVVYTLWLKRRTAWSVLWGGVAGSMPILAGRVLAAGKLDLTGLLLSLIILSWIPGHNLTLISLYPDDYLIAGVPTLLQVYGATFTHIATVLSGFLTASMMILTFLRLAPPILMVVIVSTGSVTLIILAVLTWRKPSPRLTRAHYKFLSIYMLVCMLLLSLSTLW